MLGFGPISAGAISQVRPVHRIDAAHTEEGKEPLRSSGAYWVFLAKPAMTPPANGASSRQTSTGRNRWVM